MYITFSLSIAIIITKFIFSNLLFRNYLNERENYLILGASLLFLFLAISRAFLMYFDFVLTEFDPELYQQHVIYWKFANFLTWIGFLSLIVIVEKSVLHGKTHYIISAVYFIFIIISLAIPDFNMAQIWAAIPTALGIFMIPFSYLYLAKYPHIRKKSLLIFFGYLIFFIGYLLLAEFVVISLVSVSEIEKINLIYIIHIISIIFRFFGVTLLGYGYLYYHVVEK